MLIWTVSNINDEDDKSAYESAKIPTEINVVKLMEALFGTKE